MFAVAVIPARYASTRLPGKPLLDRTGMPLVCHVVERTQQAKTIARVIVAGDDQRIIDAVESRGGQAVMTRADHPNGTSRIAEVADALPPDVDIIVNVQGDEPELEPDVIDLLVERLRAGDEPMATLASAFADDEDPADPNIVKIVIDQHSRAMYFSRSLIPYPRDNPQSVQQCLKHPGLYAFRREFLSTYVNLPPTPAEQAEQLEQLRALEHGYDIAVARADVRHHGVDTPEQYEDFVRRFNAK